MIINSLSNYYFSIWLYYIKYFWLIEINIKTLIEQCADDSKQLNDEFTLISQLYKEYIIKTNGFTKANENFLTSLRTKTSRKTARTDLYISPTNYLQRLKQILSCSVEKILDDKKE